ncbi:MAG: hypothetical protein JO171_13050 [Paludibacterium sp.]|uniref:hypothetical protein n=1 Tax=Paludibacterium sp. TaxID=1917523 RepID=UPI0025ED7ED0|nr:hypothetical protein [Paludibacterium sp.]MBV8048080.1 hypothetical protein [Paludibacterium sp.]
MFIGRLGTQDVVVPANQSIIVNSPGPGLAKVYYLQNYSAGNILPVPSLQAILNAQQQTFGPFATAQTVRLEASAGCELEYVVGVQPSLAGLNAQPPINFKNLLDGGDMTVNPFQRNIPGLAAAGVIATAITNAITYFADRYFGIGAATSAILFSKVADLNVPGFNASLKFQRQAANADVNPIKMGQVIETADSVHLQGQPVTLSFWARTGLNYSGGNLSVQLYTGTGTNDTAANMVGGAWAGSATPINAQQALTGVMTRYQFTGVIPANATQVGFLLSLTPTGVAGADDSVYLNGFQLEVGSVATAYERRDAQVELEICQRYAWVTAEPAAGVVVGSGLNTGAANQLIYMATPVQLLKVPTVTVSAGTFKTNQAGVATATAITAGATHTPNAISVNGNSAGTAGQGTLLQGGGGSGYIIASADF